MDALGPILKIFARKLINDSQKRMQFEKVEKVRLDLISEKFGSNKNRDVDRNWDDPDEWKRLRSVEILIDLNLKSKLSDRDYQEYKQKYYRKSEVAQIFPSLEELENLWNKEVEEYNKIDKWLSKAIREKISEEYKKENRYLQILLREDYIDQLVLESGSFKIYYENNILPLEFQSAVVEIVTQDSISDPFMIVSLTKEEYRTFGRDKDI